MRDKNLDKLNAVSEAVKSAARHGVPAVTAAPKANRQLPKAVAKSLRQSWLRRQAGRWDGRGDPNGKAAVARVIATHNAMTAPYDPATAVEGDPYEAFVKDAALLIVEPPPIEQDVRIAEGLIASEAQRAEREAKNEAARIRKNELRRISRAKAKANADG